MPEDDVHQRIHAGLSALIISPPRQRRSALEDQLEPHRTLIAQALAKGHTYRSISAILNEAGLKASPESVRRYVQRTNGRSKTKARRVPKKTG